MCVNKLKVSFFSILFLGLLATNLCAQNVSNANEIQKQREKMERVLSIAENERNSNIMRGKALFKIVKDKEILRHPGLKDKFRRHLWELIKQNKKTDFAVWPLDALGCLSNFYKKTSPDQKEEQFFLELLIDSHNSPIVRSTVAYFLRNTSNRKTKGKVKSTATMLFKRYIKDPKLKDSRVVGRLCIVLEHIYGLEASELLNTKDPVKLLEEKRTK